MAGDARFAAGTRSSQVQSRKKQIEKLQISELKKSNIVVRPDSEMVAVIAYLQVLGTHVK